MKSLVRIAIALAATFATGQALGEVVFELPADAITSPPAMVCMTGSFNGWNTMAAPMAREGVVYRVHLNLADGRHYYKFVWHDNKGETHWLNDPQRPYLADNGICGANNVMDVENGETL